MTSFDDEENLDALVEGTTRDPFQLELLNAVKKRQKKETGYITNDRNDVSRHDPALDIKMSKFLANKQSPYHSEGRPGESSSKRTSSDLWSPGTSHVNKPLHNIERQIPSIEISTDEDIGIGSDDSGDSDDKYPGKGKQQSKAQKSANSRRTSIKEEVITDAKPSVPRPGLVKRPAFHSDLPDDQQKSDGTSLKKIEKKQEKLKPDDGKKMINGKGVTTPNKHSKKEDIYKESERNMFSVDKDSKNKHISREHRSQFDNSLEKRKFGRTTKLEISDEDSSNDSDVMDVHSEYRQQIKDASSKRIPGSRLTHHSSNEMLDDDDHDKRDRQKKETKSDKNADKLRAQHISRNRTEEKNDDFSITRSHRDRVSSPDELERKSHLDKKSSKQLYIDDDDNKRGRQKKDTKSDKNADKLRAQHISRNRSEEKHDDFARSSRDRASSDELERKSHIDKKGSKQFYIDDDDDFRRDRQTKETKSDKNAETIRAQHTSRNKSQEKQDDFSITRSSRDRVSSPDELKRKSPIDRKSSKQPYIGDYDDKRDRQTKETKSDKNAETIRAQHTSRNKSQEKQDDFSITRSSRGRVSSPDELKRKSPIDRKSSKQPFIDDYDDKRDRLTKETKSDKNADKLRAQHISKNRSQEKQDDLAMTRSPRDRVSSPDDAERKSRTDKKGSKQPHIDAVDDLFSSDSRRRQSVASNNNESRSRSGSTKGDKGDKMIAQRDKSKERSSRSQDRLDYEKEAQKVPKHETPARPRSGVVKGHDKDIKDKRSSSKGRLEHDSNLPASITKKYGPSISVESDLLSSDDSDFEIRTSFNRSKTPDRETAAKLEPAASNQLRHKRAGSLGSALSNEHRRDRPTDSRESDGGRRRSNSDLQSNPWDERKLSERADREQNEFSIRKSGSLGSLLHRKESTTKQEISSPRTKAIGGRREKEHVSESVKNGKPRIKENLAPNRLNSSKSRAKNDYRTNPDSASDSEDDFERENLRIKKQASKEGTTGRASTNKLRHAGKTDGVSSKTGPLKANMNIGDATLKKTRTKNQETSGYQRQTNKRSLSFTNISNISPQSPYYEDSQEEDSRPRATDSASLREQIYYEWLKKKDSGTKTQVLRQRQEKKEKAEEAEREQQDKKIMSKKAFEAWTTNKIEKSKETESTLKEKKLSEKEKQDELRQKKLDSKKYFESWKAKKDEDLIETHRKKKREEREQRQKELEDKDEKMNSSKKVYENWKSKKDDVLKEKIKQQKLQEKEQRMIEYEKQEKKKKAEKVFENWKEKKPRSPRDSGPTLTQRAWCPSSRNCGDAVPQQIQPVIQRNPPNRTRTLSASRTMSASARYDSLRKTSHRS